MIDAVKVPFSLVDIHAVVTSESQSWRRRLLPGVDELVQRDWIVWLALLLVVVWTVLQIGASGWAVLIGVPVAFLVLLWLRHGNDNAVWQWHAVASCPDRHTTRIAGRYRRVDVANCFTHGGTRCSGCSNVRS